MGIAARTLFSALPHESIGITNGSFFVSLITIERSKWRCLFFADPVLYPLPSRRSKLLLQCPVGFIQLLENLSIPQIVRRSISL